MIIYKVITAGNAEDLGDYVNYHLKDGWNLQGGVSVYYNSKSGMPNFTQAMVYKK